MTHLDPASVHQRITGLLTGTPLQGYAGLRKNADLTEVQALAGGILEQFSGQNERGLLCVATEDRITVTAALLAALAGGPVLLLPHAGSDQVMAAMYEETGYTAALSERSRTFPPGVRVVSIEHLKNSGPIHSLPPVRLEAELLRLYTGGSTGTPKIWSKTGHNLLAEAFFLADHFQVGPDDRLLATVSPRHIYGLLYTVLLPLVSGATVLPGTPSFPEEIIHSAQEHAATILIGVPPHYRALHAHPGLGSSLRLAFSSAGMLDPADNAEFHRHNPAGVVEVYGSTETGGIALRQCSQGEKAFTPYPVLDWRIVMERLLIRSPFLSPGLARDEDGFFLTGDRVAAWGDTGFQLKGRADSIIKVAGKRVDLEEIRALIREMPAISDCLLLALPETGGRAHRIVALVEAASLAPEAVRQYLATRCEPHALPRIIKVLDRLPLKPNGKVDHEAVVRLF